VALSLDVDWLVSPKSDQMGYRLEGPVLDHADGFNIVSDGTAPGSIQVPGNGQPLVLLADRGTTGGYPKIATVITADLSRLSQTPAGGRVRFVTVQIEEAQAEARRFVAMLASIPSRVEALVRDVPSGETLFSANLAGRAVNALDPQTWQDAHGRDEARS
jgi:5-oxoprolinase (ATP-hydrolysing) subunit C